MLVGGEVDILDLALAGVSCPDRAAVFTAELAFPNDPASAGFNQADTLPKERCSYLSLQTFEDDTQVRTFSRHARSSEFLPNQVTLLTVTGLDVQILTERRQAPR